MSLARQLSARAIGVPGGVSGTHRATPEFVRTNISQACGAPAGLSNSGRTTKEIVAAVRPATRISNASTLRVSSDRSAARSKFKTPYKGFATGMFKGSASRVVTWCLVRGSSARSLTGNGRA